MPRPNHCRSGCMRDYRHLDGYLDQLSVDIYAQPPDKYHQELMWDVIQKWIGQLKVRSVLDVGCGQGESLGMLAQYATDVRGVTLGTDYEVCKQKGLAVERADMSFLPYNPGEFDLIFARHALEHSPMPLLTLMEWRRVSKQWLILVVPSLSAFEWYGKNHYYVLLPQQWLGLIERAGWKIIMKEDSQGEFEHRFLCEVTDDRNPEGFRTHPKDA